MKYLNQIALGVMSVLAVASMASAQAPILERMDVVMQAVPDGPIARVNDTYIPRDEFMGIYINELTRLAMQSKGRAIPDGVRVQIALGTMRLLVERELLFQQGSARGLKCSEAEIQEGWQSELGKLQESYAHVKEGQTLTEEMVLEKAGLTREAVMAEIRRSKIIERMESTVLKEKALTVSEAEIKEEYGKYKDSFRRPDMFHLKQMFIRTPAPNAKDAVEARKAAHATLEEALLKIRSGQRFDVVAEAVSTPVQGKVQVELGPAPADTLPPFLMEAARPLAPGEVSAIIDSEFGAHVVQMIEFLPGADPSFEEVKPRIQKGILARKEDEAIRTYCEERMEEKDKVMVFLQLEETLSTLASKDTDKPS